MPQNFAKLAIFSKIMYIIPAKMKPRTVKGRLTLL